MPKLFVFAIGGTGSRVIKSLAFLLASGVNINAREVIPIIVDPDRANGDMRRTIEILKNYQRIRGYIQNPNDCSFFSTPIRSLAELTKLRNGSFIIPDGFHFELEGIASDRFRDFIDYGGLDDKNKALINLLFSEDNLNSTMDVGFKGNPNIGSVVLNQFKDSKEFKCFASNFDQDDRVFIVSSIFGGTGAAGFPLILKNIRNAGPELPSHQFLRNARIGAITVLPYFGIIPTDEKQSKIDKNAFISKSKAALAYYARNVSGNNSLNALYYIGDKTTKDYDNVEGSTKQENDAHFIELAAALSIVDFMNIGDHEFEVTNGRAVDPRYKEFGIASDNDPITFNDLTNITQTTIRKPLIQYFFFDLYMKKNIPEVFGQQPWTNRSGVKYEKTFCQQDFYFQNLSKFNIRFREWLKEMRGNSQAFAPFILEDEENRMSNIFNLIRDVDPKRSIFKNNFVLYDHILNKVEKNMKSTNMEDKFLSLFSKTTEIIYTKKYE